MHSRSDRALDQVDVTFILFDRHLDEYGIGIDELTACLVEKLRNGFNPRKNIPKPRLLGRVVVREGLEQRASEQFHVDGGVVLVILNAVELQQSQRNLVV